jgi:hypothetical protein
LREFQGAHGRARRKAKRTFKAGLKTRWFEVV